MAVGNGPGTGNGVVKHDEGTHVGRRAGAVVGVVACVVPPGLGLGWTSPRKHDLPRGGVAGAGGTTAGAGSVLAVAAETVVASSAVVESVRLAEVGVGGWEGKTVTVPLGGVEALYTFLGVILRCTRWELLGRGDLSMPVITKLQVKAKSG